MRPGPSQEGRVRGAASSQEERPKPAAKAFVATPAHLLDAPWNRAAVAAAAVGERGGASWWKPKPSLKPASKAAPWNQLGYVPAVRMSDCERPLPGQALSANMPIRCPACPFCRTARVSLVRTEQGPQQGPASRPCTPRRCPRLRVDKGMFATSWVAPYYRFKIRPLW